ncbi:MAG: hypothetical protein KDG50_15105 [Chromatiales bacterium]|nr:hypothetical protein [Chromatiales bacterium]
MKSAAKRLELVVEEVVIPLDVPDNIIAGASEFFDRLDRDLDAGWQMSRDWIASPDRDQRVQIVAHRLLSALEAENVRLAVLLAGYIAARAPHVERIELDTSGEMQATQLQGDAAATPQMSAPPPAPASAGVDRLEALAQAQREVSQPYKVGRSWRFSIYNQSLGIWEDGPTVKTEAEADDLRAEACRRRFNELAAGLKQ